MNAFVVSVDRCIRCGACIEACGRHVLVDTGEGLPGWPPTGEALCNACGHCGAICPVGAVSPPKCGGQEAEPMPSVPAVSYDAARNLILSCRSMRRFKEESVDKGVVHELLDVARRAPTASNKQELRWMVMEGRDKAKKFTELTVEWFDTVVRNDPVLKARYNVDNVMRQYENGEDPILRGAPNAVFCLADASELWGATDAAIAATYFSLAAHARGVGSCWCGFGVSAVKTYAPLREFLGLQETDAVYAMLFFGYPTLSYAAYPPRKPLTVRWL